MTPIGWIVLNNPNIDSLYPKSQKSNSKQIPMTHPPPVDQTKVSSTDLPDGIITGRPGFVKRYDRSVVKVLVIEYWNLVFICDLVLEICDFMVLSILLMSRLNICFDVAPGPNT